MCVPIHAELRLCAAITRTHGEPSVKHSHALAVYECGVQEALTVHTLSGSRACMPVCVYGCAGVHSVSVKFVCHHLEHRLPLQRTQYSLDSRSKQTLSFSSPTYPASSVLRNNFIGTSPSERLDRATKDQSAIFSGRISLNRVNRAAIDVFVLQSRPIPKCFKIIIFRFRAKADLVFVTSEQK